MTVRVPPTTILPEAGSLLTREATFNFSAGHPVSTLYLESVFSSLIPNIKLFLKRFFKTPCYKLIFHTLLRVSDACLEIINATAIAIITAM